MLDYMQELGIEPNATLWHFTHPTWFENAGAWSKEENIPYFVEFSKVVFREFGKRFKLWATFNEPTVRKTYQGRQTVSS
jgi:beta-glucosidase